MKHNTAIRLKKEVDWGSPQFEAKIDAYREQISVISRKIK